MTGGLTFAGGPGNNYVTHSIATMVERLREDPGSLGLTTAVGWYLTKHAIGLYGTRRPRGAFAALDVQAQVDASSRRTTADGVATQAIAESCSVVYDRDGAPTVATVAALLGDGRRAIGKTTDPGTLAAITTDPVAGRSVEFDGEGAVALG